MPGYGCRRGFGCFAAWVAAVGQPRRRPLRRRALAPVAAAAVQCRSVARATVRRACLSRRPTRDCPDGARYSSPLDTGVKLKPAPFAPTDFRFPINLATALRLSDARPLIVAAAQASVWVAEAELTQAKVLWIPDAQHRLRLHPPRRRRPRLQQGHPDRAEHELLLRAVPA